MLANEVYAHAAVSRMSWGACRCDGKGTGWEEASARMWQQAGQGL